MIIRFDEELKVENILAEDSINVGNNLTNEIKVFMPDTFDINSNKGYINFRLSDGKEYNNLIMERNIKLNETNTAEMCYHYSLPKFLTKQKGPLFLSIRISPISNTNVVANTGVVKTEVYYAIVENGDEVIDPIIVEQLRKEISESESSLKLYVQETIKNGYDLRVVGTVENVNYLPTNLTHNDAGESYYVGETYPRDVYTWGYINTNMDLGWTNQGPLKVLSDDPVLKFANSEYEKTLNKFNFDEFKNYSISQGNVEFDYINETVTLSNPTGPDQNCEFIHNVKLKPNTHYLFSVKATGNYQLLAKTREGNYLSSSDGPLVIRTYDSGELEWIRIDNESLTTNVFSEFMLHEDTVQLPFREGLGDIVHKKDITSIYLWENPNLSSDFPDQNIYASRQGKKFIAIDFMWYSSPNAIRQRFIFKNISNTQGYIVMVNTNGEILRRQVTIGSEFIHFTGCSPNDNHCIPVAIYEFD